MSKQIQRFFCRARKASANKNPLPQAIGGDFRANPASTVLTSFVRGCEERATSGRPGLPTQRLDHSCATAPDSHRFRHPSAPRGAENLWANIQLLSIVRRPSPPVNGRNAPFPASKLTPSCGGRPFCAPGCCPRWGPPGKRAHLRSKSRTCAGPTYGCAPAGQSHPRGTRW